MVRFGKIIGVLFIVFSLISCNKKKEDEIIPPTITQKVVASMTAMLNGTQWSAVDPTAINFTIDSIYILSIYGSDDNGKAISLETDMDSSECKIGDVFIFNIDNINQSVYYSEVVDSSSNVYAFYEGQITITDCVPGEFISGTFNFRAVYPWTDDTVVVSEGIFSNVEYATY